MGSDVETQRLSFILELSELTRKYGIAIGGCGCCGSPWLDDSADISDMRAGYGDTADGLKWVAPSDACDWQTYSADIVRAKE